MLKNHAFSILKKTKKKIENILRLTPPPFVSYCRRIEKVKTNKKICAITFDDGPTREADITLNILKILDEFHAKGTFNVIGTTAKNYPDRVGKVGSVFWSGVKYDHYPKFNSDIDAGAENCPELIEKIISSGHEISSHSYSHIIFGKKRLVYSKRAYHENLDSVLADLGRLHSLMSDRYGYDLKFARSPHYVDKIEGGFTSFDAFSKFSYNYLASSFSSEESWSPEKTEEEEREACVRTLEEALEKDEFALSGKIIFQKDGYNMSCRSAVLNSLPKQLEILKNYGYTVVTVSELLQESPFSDVGRDDPDFEIFSNLIKTYPIAYSDNTLHPDRPMSRGELSLLISPKVVSVDERINFIKNNTPLPLSVSAKHPYSASILWSINEGLLKKVRNNACPDRAVVYSDFENLGDLFDLELLKGEFLTRRTILKAFKR